MKLDKFSIQALAIVAFSLLCASLLYGIDKQSGDVPGIVKALGIVVLAAFGVAANSNGDKA